MQKGTVYPQRNNVEDKIYAVVAVEVLGRLRAPPVRVLGLWCLFWGEMVERGKFLGGYERRPYGWGFYGVVFAFMSVKVFDSYKLYQLYCVRKRF